MATRSSDAAPMQDEQRDEQRDEQHDEQPGEQPGEQSTSPDTKSSREQSRGGSIKDVASPDKTKDGADEPSLPDEEAPPLPDEPVPQKAQWECRQVPGSGEYYYINLITEKTQWEAPEGFWGQAYGQGQAQAEAYGQDYGQTYGQSYGSYGQGYDQNNSYQYPHSTSSSYGAMNAYATTSGYASTSSYATAGGYGTNNYGTPTTSSSPQGLAGGYNPAIHGNYDPNADYAIEARKREEEKEAADTAARAAFAQQQLGGTAHFNRFTGRYESAPNKAEHHNDENKSKRQMNAFFDVDAAANSHNGRSLKAERRAKALSKKELNAFKKKNREKKEAKRRAWLKD